MSPGTAVESPVFFFYVAVTGGLLAGAGAALAGTTWLFRKDVRQAWDAYIGWLFIVPILLACFFLGRQAVIVAATVVAGLGFREFARASELGEDRLITGAVYAGIGATAIASLASDPSDGSPGWYGMFMALPVFVIALILAVPVMQNRSAGQLRLVGLATVGFMYFGWMFGHLGFLANSAQSYSYLGYLVLAVAINDVAAYSFGKLFGRRLLRQNISPKKTWEGALGALAVALAFPWLVRFTLPRFEPHDCLAIGLMVGIGGQLGDLVTSVFKRDLGVKDMGTTIPGHGGILDRIDSLTYVAPLFFHYVRFRFGLSPSP